MKRGKKYIQLKEKVDRTKAYTLGEAVGLAKATSYSKFDGTLEISTKINYKSLQNVRGTISLPHGTGKTIKVLVFCKGDKQNEAREAGADFVGDMDLIEKVSGGWTDFDACVATPDMMKEVGKLGPVLGRKGLMPKPKAGTVTTDVTKAVKELKAGRIEYRPDKGGVVHLGVGKCSFSDDKLSDNINAVVAALMKDKPSDAKGDYLKSFSVAATMGIGVKVDVKELVNANI
ncbi:50S ribosomal protein L1 [Leptospira levettii]|uniref:Large ribosomal subunit protein uL1 n=4 Tax=Leptospira TaxID=171 RepID=A0A2N0AYZ1_9LEPT|nr:MULTISPECIES: 50S ribosomal protein L1 [Leptospira]PKA22029.1 50S ribosomal protein L1 [Leptospira sp. mixed culture ATI2-C-A1]MBL0954497.1 50S ribosomal protein L1 [Leptospira sp.]MCG6149175.1 50S ribosomal protein L1 [Leptospira levettii]MCW7462907.1 50S ribosomal protein L1 [Leptospira limi]MCW7466266.1 50S ribosomal protein L1 [Leptospira levettii]